MLECCYEYQVIMRHCNLLYTMSHSTAQTMQQPSIATICYYTTSCYNLHDVEEHMVHHDVVAIATAYVLTTAHVTVDTDLQI